MSETTTGSADEGLVYEIEGRPFRLPCEVRRARSGAATYLVSAEVARSLVPGDDFEVVEMLPGRALLSLAMIDYQDNDLGDYDEVSVALFVRPRGQPAGLPYLGSWIDMAKGRLGVHILHLPVNQSFTCEAGCKIWGYPKTVQDIRFETTPDRATCRLEMDGAHALTLSVRRGGDRTMSGGQMLTYSYVDGAPVAVRATQEVKGFGMHFGGARLELGSGAIADQLRALGLPKRPLMSVWMEHMSGVFGAPEKL